LDEKKAIGKVIEELKKKYVFKDIIVNYDEENSKIGENYDDKKDYLEEVQSLHFNLKKLKKILNEKFSENQNTKFENVALIISKNNYSENKRDKDMANSKILDKEEERKNNLNITVEIIFPINKQDVVINSFSKILEGSTNKRVVQKNKN
jgi:hypothetical protein